MLLGPHCNHCGLTLAAHPERGLSGVWGQAGDKRFHIECFQKFAGPRYEGLVWERGMHRMDACVEWEGLGQSR